MHCDVDGLAVFHGFHLGLPVQHVQQPALVIGQMDMDPAAALVQPLVDHLQQTIDPLAGPGGDGADVHAVGPQVPGLHAVALIEYVDPWNLAGSQFHNKVLHHLRLVLPLRVGHVDDVEQQVCVFQFLQRGLESLQWLSGIV